MEVIFKVNACLLGKIWLLCRWKKNPALVDLARVELLALLLLQDWVLLRLGHFAVFLGLILQQVDGSAFLFLQVNGQDN